MVVSHNLAAMNAQRQYGLVEKNKVKSMEKLSSGYKINRASDDAAGLAISEKMRKQIRGLKRGVENAQDGVSFCQVADGALTEVHSMLQRMNELAVQAANGTNSQEDRKYIQSEVKQILEEIDRISETTRFNDQKIFADEASQLSVPLPENSVEKIRNTISITGTPANLTDNTYTITASETQIEINGDIISWNDVKDENGNRIQLSNLKEAIYTLEYNGVNISFTTHDNISAQNLIDAINGITFDVDIQTTQRTPVKITSYGVVEGSDTEAFLSKNGTRYLYEGGYRILADEDGVYLEDYPNQKKTWTELGVDLDNPGGQTIQFSDDESGVYFNATIADDATKDDLISAFNYTKFHWGYIDMSTRENARLGYSADRITAPMIRDGAAPLKSVQLVSFDKIYDELFDKLGYTSKASKLNDIKVSVSISGTTRDDLKLTITAENGNSTDLYLYSWDPAIWEGYGHAKPVFGYNDGAQIKLYSTYINYNPPSEDDAIAYLGTLGEVASEVSISSPYYFKYETRKITQNTYSIGDVTIPKDTNPTTEKENINLSQKTKTLWIQSGCDAGDGITLSVDRMNTRYLGIDNLDVSTEKGADKAMQALETALVRLSANRSKIGAQQNRLEHTIRNEENIIENTTAAESRIRDTDMAKEMVELSKSNILAQAGQSILAQANQSTQGVLSLLG